MRDLIVGKFTPPGWGDATTTLSTSPLRSGLMVIEAAPRPGPTARQGAAARIGTT